MNARSGFFCAAYELRNAPILDQAQHDQLEALLDWFRKNVAIPKRFNKSKSKGYYRRDAKGLSWFRADANEALGKAFELVALLKENGYQIELLRTGRIGYIIYEDDVQTVAEPFLDTPI
ncbi:hypothetical protein [Parasulfitobacter algicola]|uniref:Uncharacterized protein n=1 Tax=Parasulfitobacter algicola TaxID=2614809 RepID=A0ABX2IN38_9RHOB|nr:hypothetical protein [Sulfitobacter algicola]NSX53396.1 hypothetical protein [Sulfitobacter algicola]